jgi:Holliday junction resolvase RusA-like endonuclease
MPADYERNKRLLRLEFGHVPDYEMVDLRVTAVRPIPKSWSKKKRQEMAGRPALPTPDCDNIGGAVMDALFEEDRKVVSLFVEKVWGEAGQMVITIKEVL